MEFVIEAASGLTTSHKRALRFSFTLSHIFTCFYFYFLIINNQNELIRLLINYYNTNYYYFEPFRNSGWMYLTSTSSNVPVLIPTLFIIDVNIGEIDN